MNAYLGMLESDHGGYVKITDDCIKDEDLLSMTIDNNLIYPCFQFRKNSFVQLDGFVSLLGMITTNVSNVRKGNFFLQKFNYTTSEPEIRVYEVLRRGVTLDEWNVLVNMAKNFGTNNLM